MSAAFPEMRYPQNYRITYFLLFPLATLVEQYYLVIIIIYTRNYDTFAFVNPQNNVTLRTSDCF